MTLDKIINVAVLNKIAMADGTVYICGNSDFEVEFEFDREWDGIGYKTARFIYAKTFIDVLFNGTRCPVPVISNVTSFKIGVFAGNLSTTTPAQVFAKKSILCSGGLPATPTADIYNQILDKLNDLDEASPEEIAAAVEEYMEQNPMGTISNEEIDNILSGE